MSGKIAYPKIFLKGVDTEAAVLAIRATALSLISKGKVSMTLKMGDTEIENQFALPPSEVMRQCNDFLQLINPETYGRKIKRTSFDYRFS